MIFVIVKLHVYQLRYFIHHLIIFVIAKDLFVPVMLHCFFIV